MKTLKQTPRPVWPHRRAIATFKEFPLHQKPASFNLDEVMQKMTEQPGK